MLVPLRSPPADRPLAPPASCAACGADVDPLRAAHVLSFEDGLRFLCGERCLSDFRRGVRSRRKPVTPASGTPRHHTPLSSRPPPPGASPATGIPLPTELPTSFRQWLGAGFAAAAIALVLGLFSEPGAALASAASTSLAALIALRLGAPAIRDVGLLAWALGPIGALGAAYAAYGAAASGNGGRFGLCGAAIASAALLVRASFDSQTRAPIERAVTDLLARWPQRVYVPVKQASDPLAVATARVEANRVRTGEEIVAMKGHVLAVDGVVQAGGASVLPYPGATTTVRRAIGDGVLAGATVIDGALRVLATRVGEDRALSRIVRFGRANERDAAPLLRLAADVVRYGSPAVVLLALAAVALAGSRGLTSPLSAASAVLIAAPLLALRRGTEWAFIGGAASAGARGIVFQHGSALEHAGHVNMVAMAPHRTLTEGKPEVVEVHFLGSGDNTELLALVAAAEHAVGEHPIARAIAEFASSQGLPQLDVRRAVSVAGRGVTAIAPNGEEIVIGSRRLLLDHSVSVATADADAARAEAAGRTAIFVAVAGRVRAVITLQDHLRVGARAAIQRMFDMDLEVVLLTGAQRRPIEELAAGLDIAHVKAELLPEERGHEVRSLREAGARVAVIGYPVEDDAALSTADVGIVLGAAGSPAGEKAVALVGEDVRDAASALWIARATRDAALSSTVLALIGFAAIVGAAAAGLLEPFVAALFSLCIDAYALRAGARLLRRIALRLPAWT